MSTSPSMGACALAGWSVYFFRNRFPFSTYAVQPPAPSPKHLSPSGLVAVLGASSNHAIPPDRVTVSGPSASDVPTGKNTMPPRGTRLTSQGAALSALLARIVYVLVMNPVAASAE